MTGRGADDPPARPPARPQAFPAREHDKVRLDRLLDQARTQGPILLVAGEYRAVLSLESDLPGAVRIEGATSAEHRTPRQDAPGAAGRGQLDVSTVTLTPRELQIAQLAATGQRAPQIARTLLIAPQTVRIHLNAVRSRCRAATLQEALHALAQEHSWRT